MTTARAQQICLEDTQMFHVMGRCVRRSHICGEDHLTGKSYEHRKQWIIDKLVDLTSIFAIDVCAFSIMSNHYHVVLRVNTDLVENWQKADIVERWTNLFTGSVLVSRYMAGDCTTEAEEAKAEEIIAMWKERLLNISWFMRCLNENIARRANKEDNCKGRFWEGRFKSQALLDEQALLTCMVYVDLNPIRAGIAETLEESEYTSIQQRIAEFVDNSAVTQSTEILQDKDNEPIELVKFTSDNADASGIPYSLEDYFELTDWTGRAILENKKGFIPEKTPLILDTLGIETEAWLETVGKFEKQFFSHVGPVDKMQKVCDRIGKKWMQGIRACKQFWGQPGLASASDCPYG